MQVVCRDDPREVFNVKLNIVDRYAQGDGLQEDARCGFAQGDGRGEDNDGNDEGDEGIKVVFEGPGGEPDDESGGDNADVAESVAKDVEENAAHVEVRVRMATFRTLDGLDMLMTCVCNFVVLRRRKFGKGIIGVDGAVAPGVAE